MMNAKIISILFLSFVLILSCVSIAIADEENLSAIPVAEDDALIFPPGEDAVMTVRAENKSGETVKLLAYVREFEGTQVQGDDKAEAEEAGGTVIAYGVRPYYRIDTIPDRTVGQGEAAIDPGFDGEVDIALGKMPEGFYMVEFSFQHEGKELKNLKYPLGVFEMPEEGEIELPAIPIGVYTRFMQYRRTEDPIVWKTYIHAISNELRKRNINALVATGGFDEGEVEIYNRYGIVGISRGGGGLDHPGIIASLHGDEPKPDDLETYKARFDEVREEHPDKILTTCMVGEGIGLGGPGDPVRMWRELQPKVRMFRWYGVKKHFYDALHHIHYKGILPFTSVIRIVEASDDSPWWVVLPAFGGDQDEAYFQNPSPEQLSVLIHLSLAYGADGLIFYEYQFGLADPVNLKPRDEKLDTIGEIAGYISEHSDVFQSIKHVGLDIRCPSPVVRAVPVEADGQNSVYAVNMDPENAVTTRLMLRDDVWSWTMARDLFADEEFEIGKDGDYLFIDLELEPGDGKLILTDAVVDRK